MRLLLIPVTSGLPVIEAYLCRLDEGGSLTPLELGELSALTVRFVGVAEALLDYAESLAGRQSPN